MTFASITSGVAHAAPPRAKPSDTQDTQVKAILREAVQEFELGNWTEARALFERVHELQPTARTFRAIGLSAFEEKSYAVAVSNLSQALTDTRNPLDASQRSKAEDVLRRARGFVAEYKLDVSPASAQLTVDGHKPIILDNKLLLDPGDRVLSATAPGHQTMERHISARPREDGFLHVALTPDSATPGPAVVAKHDEPRALEQPLTKPAPKDAGLGARKITGIGVASAGVAGLAVSLGFGIRAKNKRDDSNCDGTVCTSTKGERLNDQALRAGNISTATLIIGSAALVTGTVLFFWPSKEKRKEQHAQLAPAVGRDYVGLGYSARW